MFNSRFSNTGVMFLDWLSTESNALDERAAKRKELEALGYHCWDVDTECTPDHKRLVRLGVDMLSSDKVRKPRKRVPSTELVGGQKFWAREEGDKPCIRTCPQLDETFNEKSKIEEEGYVWYLFEETGQVTWCFPTTRVWVEV